MNSLSFHPRFSFVPSLALASVALLSIASPRAHATIITIADYHLGESDPALGRQFCQLNHRRLGRGIWRPDDVRQSRCDLFE